MKSSDYEKAVAKDPSVAERFGGHLQEHLDAQEDLVQEEMLKQMTPPPGMAPPPGAEGEVPVEGEVPMEGDSPEGVGGELEALLASAGLGSVPSQ
jgi:hypothetical protein